jgi:hypothetical protein
LKIYPDELVCSIGGLIPYSRVLNSLLAIETDRLEIFVGFLAAIE